MVDLTKKRNRIRSNNLSEIQQQPESLNLPDLVALTSQQLPSESENKKAVLGEIKEVSIALIDTKDITEDSNTSEHESVFVSDIHSDSSFDSSLDDSDSNKMVKSQSANNSPIFEEESVVQVSGFYWLYKIKIRITYIVYQENCPSFPP